jgi:hypothetical protein
MTPVKPPIVVLPSVQQAALRLSMKAWYEAEGFVETAPGTMKSRDGRIEVKL